MIRVPAARCPECSGTRTTCNKYGTVLCHDCGVATMPSGKTRRLSATETPLHQAAGDGPAVDEPDFDEEEGQGTLGLAAQLDESGFLLQHVASLQPDPIRRRQPPDSDWIARVGAVAGRFHGREAGRCCVYLVLLYLPDGTYRPDDDDRSGAGYAVYVGQSFKAPKARFFDHIDGIKSSYSVRRFGLRLLARAGGHLREMSRKEALRIEAELAVALKEAGICVRGGH